MSAIESGDVNPSHFDVLGDDWDVAERARATLDRIGLTGVELSRTVGALSGGESVLAAVAGLQLAGDRIVLLDEPTNNLDGHARRLLHDAIGSWKGALIVVSHDVALLNLMDHTAELRDGSRSTVADTTTTWNASSGSVTPPNRPYAQPSDGSGSSGSSGSRPRRSWRGGAVTQRPTSRTSAGPRPS